MSNYNGQLQFSSTVSSKPLDVRFTGPSQSMDGGLLLVEQADQKLGLCGKLAIAIPDPRQKGKRGHTFFSMFRSRVGNIMLDQPDCNDLDRMSRDPAHLLFGGYRADRGERLASQPTCSRWENSRTANDIIACRGVIRDSVVGQLPADTAWIVIEVDATVDPCHGQQEMMAHSGYYRTECFSPLLLHVLGDDGVRWQADAILRPGNEHSSTGFEAAMELLLASIRARFPDVPLYIRCDGAYGGNTILEFCEREGLHYVMGLGSNARLDKLVLPILQEAKRLSQEQNGYVMHHSEFMYSADTWAHERRIIAKVEAFEGRVEDIRFMVTNIGALIPKPVHCQKTPEAVPECSPATMGPAQGLPTMQADWPPATIHRFYCLRGDQENAIKQFKLDLSSGRTSCSSFLANQFRLVLHSAALLLMGVLTAALKTTSYAKAQPARIRTLFLKVAARIEIKARSICVLLPQNYPYQKEWLIMNQALRR